jgi:hypothetical protein
MTFRQAIDCCIARSGSMSFTMLERIAREDVMKEEAGESHLKLPECWVKKTRFDVERHEFSRVCRSPFVEGGRRERRWDESALAEDGLVEDVLT